MSHFKKTACLLAAISLLLPLSSYEYQEVQDQTKIRKLAASQINIAAIVYRKNPCFPDDVDMNDFLPVEPGKNAYIWPDAKSTAIQFIHQLTKWEMEDGDTLYLRPGVYDDGVIYTVDFTKISAPRRRIHVRGSGVSNTTLEGWIWAGHGSTIKNLTVDNRGKYSDDTSIDIDSASVTIENVIVKGGRNGLLAGPGLFGESSGSVTLNCFPASVQAGCASKEIMQGFLIRIFTMLTSTPSAWTDHRPLFPVSRSRILEHSILEQVLYSTKTVPTTA
jgi:hypothetical protein